MPLVPFEASLAARQRVAPATAQPYDIQQKADEAADEGRSFLDVAASALRQNNVLSNAPQLISDAASSFDDVYDPNFDPLADEEIAGYEPFAERFIASKSKAENQRIKRRIDQEVADREVVRQAGVGGSASAIASGVLDPFTIASLFVPVVGSGTRGVRIAKGVAANLSLDSAREVALHAEQSLRTLNESAINISAGAFLTGAFGAIATRIPKGEFNKLVKEFTELEKATHQPVESTAGAAAVGFGTTLADETVAKGGEAIAKTLGQINPVARVMTAASKKARIIMQQLADVPFLLNKNLRGIETAQSAEGEIKAAMGQRYQLIKETDAAFLEYKRAGGGLSRDQFGEQIAFSLRRGDQSMDPAIQKVLPTYRRFFDQSLKELKAAGLLGEEAGVKFAMSYLPRLYDHAKIKANRIEFENAVTAHMLSKGMIEAEARTAAADVIDQVAGSLKGHAQIAQGFVGKTGALQGRTLDMPDEVLEPWLISNVDHIMDSYFRSVTPQLVLKRRFEDLDMRQQFQDVRDEYVAMRERATTNEAKNAITKEMESTLNDLQAVRDILMGKHGLPADPDSALVKTGRVFRALNYMRLLGGQVLSSIPDAGRLMARHGLVKTAAKIGKFIASSGLRDLSKVNARRVGTALEWTLNTRGDTLGEIGDSIGFSNLDKVLRKSSNTFSRLTGMTSWNDALKTLAVSLEQDAIVRAAKGAKISDFQRGQLASLGVGDRMLGRISKELDSHATGPGSKARPVEVAPHPQQRRVDLLNRLEKFVEQKRATHRNAGTETSQGGKIPDADRLAARYLEEFKGELPDDIMEQLARENVRDLENGEILNALEDRISGGHIGQLRRLREEVLDEQGAAEDAALAAQAEASSGLWRANTEAWTDKEAAAAYERALLASADRIVLTKGAGDVPLFMSKEIGKTLLQFKSFGMAAVNRLLIPMAQGVAHGDLATINGAWMMMALGAMANTVRDTAAGVKPTTDPTRIAIEAFDRAGFTTFLGEGFDIVSGTFGGPRFGRFTSQNIVETAAGPTFGTAEDIRATLQGMFTEGNKFDPELQQKDLYRFRKLLPYQNLFYLRRVINALEGEFGELVGAKGAGTKTFMERVTETKDLTR